MRRFQHWFTIILLITLTPSEAVPATPVLAQAAYRYAFIVPGQNGQIVIKTLDPANSTDNVVDLITTSMPDNMELHSALTSPDGQWLVLVPFVRPDDTSGAMRLLNMRTAATYDIVAEPGLPLEIPPVVLDTWQRIIWSPDSQSLAFTSSHEGNYDVYIYSTINHSTINLTSDLDVESRIAWSRDSRKVALLSESCPTYIHCSTNINIYDVSSRTRQLSATVAQWGGALYDAALCHLDWSPDNQYVSFVTACDSSMYASRKEVYLLNISTATYAAITNFTIQMEQLQTPQFMVLQAAYDTLWFDTQHLLIGASYFDFPLNSYLTVTDSYQLPSGSLSTILTTDMAQEMTVNPVTGELAFRTSTGSYSPQNPSVKIGSFANGSITVLQTFSNAGCNLAWSPDGQYLAYTNRGNPLTSCSRSVQGFTFIEMPGGQLRQYTASSDTKIVPAGWVETNTTSPILFASSRDGNFEIYTMQPDGSSPTRLTNHPATDTAPVWSPDRSQIAFTSSRDGNYEIYTMNADGSNVTRLTNHPANDGAPAWSPDGAKIAFTSERDGSKEIYTMNADGSGLTRLTNHAADDALPQWSPDGSAIVFSSTRDGSPEIYTMQPDGSGVSRLTTNAAPDVAPVWSPDGTKIAFASSRDGSYDVYVMNADGSNPTRLTNHAAEDGFYAVSASEAYYGLSWSPDGTQLVFISRRDGSLKVYRMNADGTAQTRLTNTGGLDAFTDW